LKLESPFEDQEGSYSASFLAKERNSDLFGECELIFIPFAAIIGEYGPDYGNTIIEVVERDELTAEISSIDTKGYITISFNYPIDARELNFERESDYEAL
jgi:hypothetical protein